MYGYHWLAGEPGEDDRPSNSATSIGALAIRQLIAAYHPKLEWDAEDRSAWFYFYRDQMREWVFFTDARTFGERLNVVNARGLKGFCSWVLGEEDPGIWDLLSSHP
jgi:spore germination protein YaaH